MDSPPPSPLSHPGSKDLSKEFVDEVLSIYRQLAELESLRPGCEINRLLGRLVTMCCQTLDSQTLKMVLDAPELQLIIPALRDICSRAEMELEMYWATHVTQATNVGDAWARLARFPYIQNYVDLARIEICAMEAVEPVTPKSVAFIGSGPMPLTSLALLGALSPNRVAVSGHKDLSPSLGTAVMNIDVCKSAITASQTMCRTLGIAPTNMLFSQANASDHSLDLHDYDAVYLAALVGESQEQKERLVEGVVDRMKAGALLITRSCLGLKTLLYPEFDILTPSLLERLTVGAILHPYGAVVNSVIVARVTAKAD